MRIGEEFYEGHYIDTVGTDLFFSQSKGTTSNGVTGTTAVNLSSTNANAQKQSLNDCFVGQSSKRLVFKKISVVPKQSP